MALRIDERTQLEHVQQDLLRHFPELPAATVRAEFDHLVRQFEGAKIRTFVPVLIAKQARSTLNRVPSHLAGARPMTQF